MSDDPILAALARLEAGQARLEAGQAGLTDRVTSLETGQASLRAEMAAFRSGVMDELGATRVAVMDRMSGLENKITDIHADIAVNFGAVDHARRINDNTRDEMRGLSDTQARMMTLILRLQTEVAELKGKPSA